MLSGKISGIEHEACARRRARHRSPGPGNRQARGRTALRLTAALLACALVLAPLGLAPCLTGEAAAAPGATYSGRYGTCDSHFKSRDEATQDQEIAAMEEAGIRWLRFGFAWPDVEPTQGGWKFERADRAVEKLRAHGIQILGILGGSPGWANGGQGFNYPPTDIPAWQNYVTTVAERYRGKVSAWEIWNEENIEAFWMPKPDAAAFVELVKLTSPLIRAADPEATIVMGGVAGLGPGFLDTCLKAGVADYVDAIAYHPYPPTLQLLNFTPQEANCRYIVGWVRNLISSYTDKPLGIWLTELGWSTCSGSPPGVDQATQASYMTRTFVNYAGLDVDRVFYYNLWDEWNFAAWPGANYGILANDFGRKPSYYYYRTFMDLFGRAVSRAPGAAEFTCSRASTLEAHSFELDDGSLAIALWKSDNKDDTLTIEVDDPALADPVTVDPMTGGQAPTAGVTRDADGRITVSDLAVGKDPVMIKLNAGMPSGVPSQPVAPSISSISPETAAAGVEVTINGSGFGAAAGDSAVKFNDVAADGYTEYSDTRIKVKVPGGVSGTVAVTVTRDGLVSNSAALTVQENLTLTSTSPSSTNQFTPYMTVALTGTGFKKGATVRLKLGNKVLNGIFLTVDSSNRIRANFGFFLVPTGDYTAIVKNPDGQEVSLDKAVTVRPLWY